MRHSLIFQALAKFFAGVLFTGLFLFIPAGTLNYWQAWLFMVLLFVPMFIAGLIMWRKNPRLLQARLDARESQSTQNRLIAISAIMFVLGFILAGLNERFDWIVWPASVSWMGSVVFLLAYAMYGEVLRENTYLFRTVKVEKGQKVIDTGLYGMVHHPMYSATLLLFISIPLILGSLPSLIVFLIYPVVIAARIQNEETVLENSLEGYRDYKTKVRYRLLPWIW